MRRVADGITYKGVDSPGFNRAKPARARGRGSIRYRGPDCKDLPGFSNRMCCTLGLRPHLT